MRVKFKRKFEKEYGKLEESVRRKFLERLEVFKKNPRDPVLCVHKLKGVYKGYKSINVGGNYRAIFLQHGGSVTFFSIGSHSYLYKK